MILGDKPLIFEVVLSHDTFTKWMEATPVVNITQEAAVKFL
jgi:hypothetical protein